MYIAITMTLANHDARRRARRPPAPLVAARLLSLARWQMAVAHARTDGRVHPGKMVNRSCIVRVDPGHGCGQVERCRLQQATMIQKAREVIGDLEGMSSKAKRELLQDEDARQVRVSSLICALKRHRRRLSIDIVYAEYRT